jgi:phenylalanyl-tRNA synthetase alpha chain
MQDLVETVLSKVSEAGDGGKVESLKLASDLAVDHQRVVGAIKSIESIGNVLNTEIVSNKRLELTSEGKEVMKRGSHEACVFNSIPAGDSGIAQNDLMKIVGAAWGKIGFSKAMSAGWISIDKSGGLATFNLFRRPPLVLIVIRQEHQW